MLFTIRVCSRKFVAFETVQNVCDLPCDKLSAFLRSSDSELIKQNKTHVSIISRHLPNGPGGLVVRKSKN